MGFAEGDFWFSHFPIREAFLFALKAEFTCHDSLKLVPVMTFLIYLAPRLVDHMLFISLCEKTLDFRGTNWNDDMGTFQLLFISLGFTASDWCESGTNGGVGNQKSAFPIKPYLLSCSCWV